jgi:hypothetical protein
MKIIGIPYGRDMVTAIKEETDIYRKRKGLTESDIHIL